MTARPVRLRLSRARGFDLQALSRSVNGLAAINCARPGKWGNRYRIGSRLAVAQYGIMIQTIETSAQAVALHRGWLANVLNGKPDYLAPSLATTWPAGARPARPAIRITC